MWQTSFSPSHLPLRHVLLVQAASQYCIVVVTLAFVGQLGYQEMAAAAVSTTYFNFMAAFMAGMSSAFDTLASQAYGAGDTALVKVWAVTAAAVLTFITVVFSVGLWYGEHVAVVVFGQGPEVAPVVGTFCRWLIPGLHSHAMSLVLVKVSLLPHLPITPPPLLGNAHRHIPLIGTHASWVFSPAWFSGKEAHNVADPLPLLVVLFVLTW